MGAAGVGGHSGKCLPEPAGAAEDGGRRSHDRGGGVDPDGPAFGQTEVAADDPTAKLYPVQRNPRYTIDRAITDPSQANTYTNFYEFGSQKNIWRAAQNLKLRPWTVKIAGMVEQEKTVDIDTLLAQMPLEERTTGTAASKRGRWRCRGAAFP